MSNQERVAYFNGKIVPESQVLIPFRDRSFKYGDGVFDMTRTFHGRIFKLQEHIDRLYRSLKYASIEISLSKQEMMAISEDVLQRNWALLPPNHDYWVGQRVSRGVDRVGGDFWENSGPNIIIECTPLPLKARAHLYRDGIEVVFPSVQRTTPESLSPNVKSHNYLNMIIADLEVRNANPNAWALLLDTRGFLAEGMGSNIFIVREGQLFTPSERYVLPGVSRLMTMDMAKRIGVPCTQGDIDMFDAANAEEMFLTSTSLCICAVRRFNGQEIGDGKVPGPVTKRLTDAYIADVGCDFVKQYLDRLPG